ncbi:hypothetical protein AK812_SmicGene2567 [Symbiodinium microadriaticum]|uniref:Uncharacterized protein n=1 Tax=Symbiodinium microadriaticum TaxID=2951 RepID=A0A1Q9F188_SYMMI|nr:hypothetical protein AK812_SmicGene2567 [Symbiodinium microadriaticum]CAE7855493.1 unnamed protein product [Symbiodinium microadriaticum]
MLCCRLREQIAEVLKSMKNMFSDLTKKQSDALTRPFSDSILRMFADVTKQDLIMNNYIVRSVKSTAGSSKPSKKDKKDKTEKPKPSKKKGGKKSSMFPRAEQHAGGGHDTGRVSEDEDADDDLANELFVGFQTGVPCTLQLMRMYSLHVGGEAFLGGHPLDAEDAYCNMLADFWQNYAAINPECAVFKRPDYSREFASRLIPMAVHGDEGRGKAKHPIMILSVQPVIGPKGPDFVNTSGLKEYPGGCGKGHDCGVMNAWLEELYDLELQLSKDSAVILNSLCSLALNMYPQYQ